MKYLLAVILAYYLLEAGRHLVRQVRRWDSEDSSLSLGYRVFLSILIVGTCIFWPLLLFKARRA